VPVVDEEIAAAHCEFMYTTVTQARRIVFGRSLWVMTVVTFIQH